MSDSQENLGKDRSGRGWTAPFRYSGCSFKGQAFVSKDLKEASAKGMNENYDHVAFHESWYCSSEPFSEMLLKVLICLRDESIRGFQGNYLA